MTPIIVTHVLPTATAFGATLSRPSEAVFIPGSISRMLKLEVGQQVQALLVPNTMQPDRTPWLAARIERAELVTTQHTTLSDQVLEELREGGEWTAKQMAAHLGVDPNLVSGILESAYNQDLCAKYQLWRKRSDSRPSDEWFTCYPDEVDFVAGVE